MPRSERRSCARLPSRCPSTRTPTPTAREEDAGRPTSIGSPLPPAPTSSLTDPDPGEGRGGLPGPGPPAAARVPRARGGTARTYLQPGFLVAATPSDAPAASAGPRQPYRSCIASKMPIRRPGSGA